MFTPYYEFFKIAATQMGGLKLLESDKLHGFRKDQGKRNDERVAWKCTIPACTGRVWTPIDANLRIGETVEVKWVVCIITT
jgi:hypothetical protein